MVCKIKPRETTNVNSRLKELNLPILIYNGEEDMDEFLEAARHMRAEIKSADFVLIPKSGGFPCWENPDAVNNAVSSFMRNKGV